MFTVTARSHNNLLRVARRFSASLPSSASLSRYIMIGGEEYLWSFGYGSNMDVKALEAKKHVKIKGKCISAHTIASFQQKMLNYVQSRLVFPARNSE